MAQRVLGLYWRSSTRRVCSLRSYLPFARIIANYMQSTRHRPLALTLWQRLGYLHLEACSKDRCHLPSQQCQTLDYLLHLAGLARRLVALAPRLIRRHTWLLN